MEAGLLAQDIFGAATEEVGSAFMPTGHTGVVASSAAGGAAEDVPQTSLKAKWLPRPRSRLWRFRNKGVSRPQRTVELGPTWQGQRQPLLDLETLKQVLVS